MIRKKKFCILLLVEENLIKMVLIVGLLLFQHPQVCGQVQEERVNQILYVDFANPQASDQNPGSQFLPFKTISKATSAALSSNSNNVGTKILISPGTYRENVSLLETGHETEAPIIFEAIGEVTISGSDIWTDWEKAADTSIFRHSWPFTWGLAPIPSGWESNVTLKDIVRRREMVFVNGKMYDQVLSYSELKAESFFVDEVAQTIYIKTPEGINLGDTVVEVAVRPNIFSASGKTNIVLKGINFQHGNATLDEQAVRFYGSSSILVEGCQFRWNNWGGMGFQLSRNVTVRKNIVNHNGGAGIVTWKTNSLVFEDNETSHNNWRGHKGGFTGWAVAGVKNLHAHNEIFRRHKSVDNKTHGIWFDTDCEDILVEEAAFSANSRFGIYIEANQGPIIIKNSKIFRNLDYGILIANSTRVNLEGNIIYGNADSQIMVSGLYDSVRTETNWETLIKLELLAQHGSWKCNAICSTEAKQLLVSTTLSTSLWKYFVETLMSDKNIWFNPQNNSAFKISGGNQLDFAAWKSTTGQDANSSFSDPRFKDPANDDFQLFPDSPLREMKDCPWSIRPPINLRLFLK